MKFFKGMITGMVISAGAAMVCMEMTMGQRKMLKQGKKIIRKMGII